MNMKNKLNFTKNMFKVRFLKGLVLSFFLFFTIVSVSWADGVITSGADTYKNSPETVKLNGEVTITSGGTVTAQWFVWKQKDSNNPTCDGTKEYAGLNGNKFYQIISVNGGTTYSYVACATIGSDTFSGGVKDFMTYSDLSFTVSSSDNYSATTTDDEDKITSVELTWTKGDGGEASWGGFALDSSGNKPSCDGFYDNTTDWGENNPGDSFSRDFNGLEESHTYNYRACAVSKKDGSRIEEATYHSFTTVCADGDEDGVCNTDDQCNNTAAGVTVGDNGCEQLACVKDIDGDGVCEDGDNPPDKCLGTTAGVTVDSEGCECPDDNSDGVCDSNITPPSPTPSSSGNGNEFNPLGVDSMEALIGAILNGLTYILTPILVLAFIYSGFLFVSAQGKGEKLTEAKRAFSYSLIGAALILGANLIFTVITNTVGQLLS